MNRYRQYGVLDDSPEILGDGGFTRLDMLTDPAMLPAGSLAASENMRFDADGTTVRGGLARQFPGGMNLGTIYHSGIYKPDKEDDQFALVLRTRLALFQTATQTVTLVNYPSGETVEEGDVVDVVQAGVGSGTLASLYILRGLDKDVLHYDANLGTITVATGFDRGEFAVFYGDRIAVNNTRQSVGISDFLDFETFTTLNQFMILKGGDDYLTCFLPYQKENVLIGSRKAWHLGRFSPQVEISNYTDGIGFLRQLTREAGPVGPRAATEAMGAVWFITDQAIYAFVPQLDNELTILGKPISADIQPLMDRLSARYAGNAIAAHHGYRLYFALPISDEAVEVSAITVTAALGIGIALPFSLPANLTTGSLATVTTAAAHGLSPGERVLVAGAVSGELNGEFEVASVPDSVTFMYALDGGLGATVGQNATAMRIATRNNVLAVYNLNYNGWESIDSLPAGFYADWLRVADYGTRRRLWVVDATLGPGLYEEREADEVGTASGGASLPFTLPMELSAMNYATAPVAGRTLTRALRWGANPRKVKGCEVRATLPAESALTVNLLARTPNNRLWTGTRDFVASQFDTADAALRKMCGERALEAQVEIVVTRGRPTVRSVMVETVAAGRVEE